MPYWGIPWSLPIWKALSPTGNRAVGKGWLPGRARCWNAWGLTGGRVRGSGETLLLRRRLEELEEESNRLKQKILALKQALAPLASLRELEALRARVESLKARLRNPLPPPPPPPSPPEGEWEERMARDHERIEAERKRLEEALAQAEAHERWRS